MSDEEGNLRLGLQRQFQSDVGHGRARVPFDNDLNLKPNDVIEIKRREVHCRHCLAMQTKKMRI